MHKFSPMGEDDVNKHEKGFLEKEKRSLIE